MSQEKSQGLTFAYNQGDPEQEKMVALVQERYKDVNWQGQIEVSLKHSSFFQQLKRLFSKDRRINLFARATIGLFYTAVGWLLEKSDDKQESKSLLSPKILGFYNPYTERTRIFHPSKAVVFHELGHAEDSDRSKHPTLNALLFNLPILKSIEEWRASKNAMRHLTTDEREKARKIFNISLGASIGGDMGILLALPSIISGTLPTKVVGALFAFWGAPNLGALSGKLFNKISNKNIFFDKSKSAEDVLKLSSSAASAAI